MKNQAAQSLARHRHDSMTEDEKKEWKEHMRAIAKKPRKRKSKAKNRSSLTD